MKLEITSVRNQQFDGRFHSKWDLLNIYWSKNHGRKMRKNCEHCQEKGGREKIIRNTRSYR